MDEGPWIVDRFGEPIRHENSGSEPLSKNEKMLGVGGLALTLFASGEGSLLSLYPMTGHPYWQVTLAVQSSVFMLSGLVLGGYVAVAHFGDAAWPRLMRQPALWLFGIMLFLLTGLFGWLVIRNAHLQAALDISNAQIGVLTSSQWPRLTPDQEANLKRFLAEVAPPENKVWITYSDANGIGLSKDLTGIFASLHWPYLPPSGSIDAMGVTGIIITAKPNDNAAIKLKDGLHQIGVSSSVNTTDYDRRNYMLTIIVGIRVPE